MANLVSPGYNRSKLINRVLSPAEERILEFKGLNKKTVVEEGEMSDMWNLTADSYPVLMPRKPRGEVTLPSAVIRPIQMIRRFNKLGVIAIVEPDPNDLTDNGVAFFYDGVRITQVTGLTVDSRAVAINNRMCFFPQKTSVDITINGVQAGTYKALDASVTLSAAAVTVSATDAQVTLPNNHGLKADDAIAINLTSYTPSGGSATSTTFAISCAVEDVVNTNTLVLPNETFIEMTGAGVTSFTITGTIKRSVPDLNFVVEWNNRLWGCSNADNTIYACKLGDPSNWQYYQGTSMDSYYAEQGTDEVFTGIAEYSGHIIFFKPNSMTRVYGTAPSNYQITNTKTYGVEEGSSNSILTINDTVFYKSALGIMAYRGGIPFCISEKFNRDFKRVVAGTEGTKYYASCIVDDDGETAGYLMVFDIGKGLWHKEDNLRFTSTCKVGNSIYYTTATADVLVCDVDVICAGDLMVSTEFIEGDAGIINPELPTESYDDIEWMAQFGPFDEYIEEHKIYSKLAMRIKANGTASARVFISINEGPWEQVEYYPQVSTKGDFIPIIPRRCDRYSVRIEGKGNMEIKSLTRRVRQGSFGRL